MTRLQKQSEERAWKWMDTTRVDVGWHLTTWDRVNDYKRAYEEGYREAREEAAKESEEWFEMFDFNSFAGRDPRRCANPNQIAGRIRILGNEEV